MNQPKDDIPNPERRSDSALLCLCIGVGLIALAWFLGVGGIIAAAMSGNEAMLATTSISALILIPLMGLIGFIIALIGAIWLVVRVLADQASDKDEKRYRNVER